MQVTSLVALFFWPYIFFADKINDLTRKSICKGSIKRERTELIEGTNKIRDCDSILCDNCIILSKLYLPVIYNSDFRKGVLNHYHLSLKGYTIELNT